MPLQTQSSLGALPIELQLQIAACLPYHAAASLKLTNKHFYNIIEARPERGWEAHLQKLEFLRLLRSSVGPSLSICDFCAKYRRNDTAFTEEQLGSPDTNRFCIDCGILHKVYPPGWLVGTLGEETYYYCKRCRKVQSRSPRFPCSGCDMCIDLFKPGNWVCARCHSESNEKAIKRTAGGLKLCLKERFKSFTQESAWGKGVRERRHDPC